MRCILSLFPLLPLLKHDLCQYVSHSKQVSDRLQNTYTFASVEWCSVTCVKVSRITKDFFTFSVSCGFLPKPRTIITVNCLCQVAPAHSVCMGMWLTVSVHVQSTNRLLDLT